MKDMLGQEIVAGQFIAYATRSGNSGQQNLGQVLEVKTDEIKVKGATVFYSGRPLTKNERISTLSYSDRIIILNSISEQYLTNFYTGSSDQG